MRAKNSSASNRFIEDLVQRAVEITDKPAWLLRNVLRWRWQYATAQLRNGKQFDVEAFMLSTFKPQWHTERVTG